MANLKNPAHSGGWVIPRRDMDLVSHVYSVSDSYSTRIFIGQRFFGEVRGMVLYKWVRAHHHFLYSPKAIANNVLALELAWDLGARIVEIHDTESGKSYRAKVSLIFDKGFPVNRGHGRQIGLGLKHWNREDKPDWIQLKLWKAY